MVRTLLARERHVQTDSRVYVESWAQSYGSPYLIADDDLGTDSAETVESAAPQGHAGNDLFGVKRLAFIDGIRRGEASLYRLEEGRFVRGIAGAHACGAVIAETAGSLAFGPLLTQRLLIWGGGHASTLAPIGGGWAWKAVSVARDDAAAPLADLQARMRAEEGRLAETVSLGDTVVVADGPLNFALRTDRPIVGFVKRHQKAYLPPNEHARIPEILTGRRTSMFRLGDERFSCYLRLADDRLGGPWAGIVRLEFSSSLGLEFARSLADALAMYLPRYAGVVHRDPRAPQNLQPIGALEKRLRQQLGPEALAERAVRDAIARMQK